MEVVDELIVLEPLYRSSIPYHQNKEIWDPNVLRERMVWRKQRDDLCHFHWASSVKIIYISPREQRYMARRSNVLRERVVWRKQR